MSRIGQSVEVEIRLVVIQGWERREWLIKGYRVSFRVDENVLEPDSG